MYYMNVATTFRMSLNLISPVVWAVLTSKSCVVSTLCDPFFNRFPRRTKVCNYARYK